MKVFLSWSGDLSLKVALAFRDWLPAVIQAIRPYVSSEDIDKGTRWSTDIAKELEASSFGILCVTPTNLGAPWINFEAGALSKTIDKANVSPFLFGVKRSEIQGPLLQFQSTIFEKQDVARLVASINRKLANEDQLDEGLLQKSFDVWWPQLKATLDALPQEEVEKPKSANRQSTAKTDAILEELLELVRNQQRILSTPESVLPPQYLDSVINRRLRHHGISRGDIHPAVLRVEKIVRQLVKELPESELVRELDAAISRLHLVIDGERDANRSLRWPSRLVKVDPEIK